MQFVYQFARHCVANHGNTLLEDGFNSDLAANDVTDASANGSPMQRQTTARMQRQTTARMQRQMDGGRCRVRGTQSDKAITSKEDMKDARESQTAVPTAATANGKKFRQMG